MNVWTLLWALVWYCNTYIGFEVASPGMVAVGVVQIAGVIGMWAGIERAKWLIVIFICASIARCIYDLFLEHSHPVQLGVVIVLAAALAIRFARWKPRGSVSDVDVIGRVSIFVIILRLVFALVLSAPILMVATVLSLKEAMTLIGGRYMRGLSEQEIQTWINRSNRILNERKTDRAGTLRIDGAEIPAGLAKLKIRSIVVGNDFVIYEWSGGIDPTGLRVDRIDDGTMKVTAVYNDHSCDVIWPK